MALIAALSLAVPVQANPAGGVVVAGDAVIAGQGTGSVTINQSSGRAILDWQSFSVGTGENVRFVQPGKDAIAVNRVTGADASQILGNLSANGQLVLINRNGIAFGKSAVVDVAGLVATTADIDAEGFMATGALSFSNGARVPGAGIVNEGRITVRDAGLAALVAPSVRNSGVIVADMGRVALGAGTGFVVDLYGDGMIKFAPDGAIQQTLGDGSGALVDNSGTVQANGGRVMLTASAAREVVNASVNSTGIIRAEGIKAKGGTISLTGSGHIASTGLVSADSAQGQGGQVTISGGSVALGGLITASGKDGGSVAVDAQRQLSLADKVQAVGALGQGGTIGYRAGSVLETSTGVTNVSGLTHAGTISASAATNYTTSGTYLAQGQYGHGGRIDLTASHGVSLLSPTIAASGLQAGGLIRIGGAFQGGKAPDTSKSYHQSFLGRWGALTPIAQTKTLYVSGGTRINANSTLGNGGTAILWSDQQTTFLGGIDARGVHPGSVEISSAGELRRLDVTNVTLGKGGTLLLDPKNIVIGNADSVAGWAYDGILQAVAPPPTSQELSDIAFFGWSVALNGAGDRLAVGSLRENRVYLFSFTDNSFSNGALEAIVSNEFSGGKNVNLSNSAFELIGSSVAFNATGDRLAVGAFQTVGGGAVALIAFDDSNFTNGRKAATIGEGFTDTNDIDVQLEDYDNFGSSVSLNAAGTVLAVGAGNNGGATSSRPGAGAVYIFGFANSDFEGGSLKHVIGADYAQPGNLDLNLNAADGFGAAVALNGAGDRLAVGAPGTAATAGLSVGAVYLFDIGDPFNAGSALRGRIGHDYSGPNDVNIALQARTQFGAGLSFNGAGDRLAIGMTGDTPGVFLLAFDDSNFNNGVPIHFLGDAPYSYPDPVIVPGIDAQDFFGNSVSLNAAGDRLAVGARFDRGAANDRDRAGATHLFSFSGATFENPLLEGTIGAGYRAQAGTPKDIPVEYQVPTLSNDRFGFSVAFNASGDRLAVGAVGDDGINDDVLDAGAVYLFDLSGGNLANATLAAKIGAGYAGGNNRDIGLGSDDRFGSSVALNGAGDRLAVGAPGDAGAADNNPETGAVYLFSFNDPAVAFGSGALEGIIGLGYLDSKDRNEIRLEDDDRFGSAVALNNAGNQLIVGAPGDDGGDNATDEAGAVYKYRFDDDVFSNVVRLGTLGAAYYNNGDGLEALGSGHQFGSSVALSGSGNVMAVGSPGNEGANFDSSDAGAVYTYQFPLTNLLDETLHAILGRDYAMPAGLGLVVSAGERFGSAVALDDAGIKLAVGSRSYSDSSNANVGKVSLIEFGDTSHMSAALTSTIGLNQTAPGDVDLAVAPGTELGSALAYNGNANLLAIGAAKYNEMGDSSYVGGGVYFISEGSVPGRGFGDAPTSTIRFAAAGIASQLQSGTDVVLQASNDITVSNAITVAAGSSGVGTLTLQAGRSILINASITTRDGDVTLIANERPANGVIPANRDPGVARITMANGTNIDAGTGNIHAEIRAGTDASGAQITLNSLTGNTITAISRGGPGTGTLQTLNGASFIANGSGDAVQFVGDVLNMGNATISTPNGRWLLWASGPNNVSLGSLSFDFKQYAATYAVTPVAQATGNGLLFIRAPIITPTLLSTQKTYDGTTNVPAPVVVAGGAVGDDNITLDLGTVAFTDKNAGTGNKTYEATGISLIGATTADGKPIYGYTLGSTTATNSTSTIFRKAVTVLDVVAEDKVYDGTLAAQISGGRLDGVVSLDDLQLVRGNAAFADKNAGTGKIVTASGFALSGADRDNYSITQPTGLSANITKAVLRLDGAEAVDRSYDGTTAVVINGTLQGVAAGDSITLDTKTGTMADKNVGTAKQVAASFTVTGTGLENYELVQPTGLTVNISAVTLALVGAKAVDRIYDGSRLVAIEGNSLAGLIAGDAVALGDKTGLMTDKNVGVGKAVTGALTLAGADAGNYRISQPMGLTVSISPATLILAVNDARKEANGPEPMVTYTLAGLVGTDRPDIVTGVTFSSEGFGNAPVGSYVLNASNGTAPNYTISYRSGTLSVERVANQWVPLQREADRVIHMGDPTPWQVVRDVRSPLGSSFNPLLVRDLASERGPRGSLYTEVAGTDLQLPTARIVQRGQASDLQMITPRVRLSDANVYYVGSAQ
ncbi:YDG domain-containing protein [Sphingobium sp. B12D2B]|uniref:YDG domain-containing protein n=1 Tax=Sphingobium sp. B12D2B TaxID=2940577 RepID=UPI002224CA4E|nr:YDG domain-containing protein [Sphingobium sp. B12D2B]MCW2351804.1 filamentous hemagglutinin family protein [Sphingobium sp. B12D2B]